jgi:VWFA-related protein
VRNAVSRSLLAAVVSYITLVLCSNLAGQQTEQAPTPNSSTTIRVAVNAVVMPVVVRDSQGRAVGSLKKEDFQVFDKDKPQTIASFTIEKRAGVDSDKKPAEPVGATTGLANRPATIPAIRRFIVFLFDDLHLSIGELLRMQKVATKMLADSLGGSDIAAVVSLSGLNSGLTQDRAKLEDAVRKLKVQQLFRHDDHACPNIDFYQADLIQNKHDEPALKAAEADYVTCAGLVGASPNMLETGVRSVAAQSLAMGERDVSASLRTVQEFVKKMGALPGQRTLILISPGFLTITPDATAEKSEILDLAARTDVTISALDARGLYTTEIDASERGGSSTQDLLTGQHAHYHSDEMNFDEEVMSELADGTGGTYFHNSNDLEGGFRGLAAGPEYVYLLEISLDKVKQDGSYHRLQVKVNKSGLNVQARRGYFAPKKDKETK